MTDADGRGWPNPGSPEATDLGCTCPVLDNGHGRRPPFAPDGWWITEGCPLHAPPCGEPGCCGGGGDDGIAHAAWREGGPGDD